MKIPHTNYVVDNHGQKLYVQMTVDDWELFLKEFEKMENLLLLKNKLKNALIEMVQIQNGEKQGTTLSQFLDEL